MVFEVTSTAGPCGVTVVSIVGELDMGTAPRFRQEMLRAIDEIPGVPQIVVDLAGADLLDAVGLGVVLDAAKRTRLRGGDLALARAERQVRKDLEITRVIEIMPVHDSIDAAVDALTGG